jgi:CBS domain-containing protein
MGLRDSLETDRIDQIPLRELILVEPSMTVREVATRMRERRLGCVFVVDAEGKPQGRFTEKALTKLLADSPEAMDEPVANHLLPMFSVPQTATVSRLIGMLHDSDLRFICVTDEEGRAAGLSGQKGVMEYVAAHFPRQVLTQRVAAKLFIDQREGA